jgi:hypothetical protein
MPLIILSIYQIFSGNGQGDREITVTAELSLEAGFSAFHHN